VREGEERVPVREMGIGPWADFLVLARKVSPGSFYIFISFFLLFLFCFLISFITFANLVQFASNQLCKVYKIPSNILE
jgi:hypothetical protein